MEVILPFYPFILFFNFIYLYLFSVTCASNLLYCHATSPINNDMPYF